MGSERTSADTVTTAAGTALELDDIQSGMLHQRPASYVGTYLLLRIDNREAGRTLVERLLPVIESARSPSDPVPERMGLGRVHLPGAEGARRAPGVA